MIKIKTAITCLIMHIMSKKLFDFLIINTVKIGKIEFIGVVIDLFYLALHKIFIIISMQKGVIAADPTNGPKRHNCQE